MAGFDFSKFWLVLATASKFKASSSSETFSTKATFSILSLYSPSSITRQLFNMSKQGSKQRLSKMILMKYKFGHF